MGGNGSERLAFAVLGELEVRRHGVVEPIAPGRERALLLLLLLLAPRTVSTDRLIDELWGERAPETVTTMLQVYVSRLRKALEPSAGTREVLVTERGGYRLAVAPQQVDARRAESLVGEARVTRMAGDAGRALGLLDEALGLWRGPPLADVALAGWAAAEIDRLETLHADAREERCEALLALGEHAAALPEIERQIAEHPLRERPYAQQMLALYRAGRQADALGAYQRARRRLRDELGVAPGPALRQLERAILDQDPALEAPSRPQTPPPEPEPQTRRATSRRLVGGVVASIAVLALAVAALVSTVDPRAAPRQARGTVAVLLGSPASPVRDEVPVGSGPRFAAAGTLGGLPQLWVANVVDRTLSAIDARTHQAIPPLVSLGAPPAGVAVGAGAVWATVATRAELVRVEPRYHGVRRISLPAGPGATAGPVAVGDGSVWVAVDPDQLLRIDPRSGRVRARIRVAVPASMTFGDGALWLGGWDGSIVRVDPAADAPVRTVAHLPAGVGGITVGGGSVWATAGLDGSLWRIREDGVTQRSFPVGVDPEGVAYAAGTVYVGAADRAAAVDVRTGRVRFLGLGEAAGPVVSLRVGSDSAVWAITGGHATPVLPQGVAGLARFVQHGYQGIDPALLYDPRSWQLEYATCAKLFNVADRTGPARVVPELAAGWPAVTDGGRTFTFRIRSGFRFSPPSNAPVTAAALQHTIERALSPRLGAGAPGMLFAGDIVGAAAFHSGHAAQLAGVSSHGDTLVIRLTRPAGDLPARLSVPIFCAVPVDTPATPGGVTTPIPSAGPYYVASVDPPYQLVVLRNPVYGGTRPARLRGVVWSTGVLWEQSGAQVVASDRADYIAGLTTAAPFQPGGPVDRADGGTPRAGRPRLSYSPALSLEYLDLDARHGPLRDVRLRRAVDHALDRPALARVLALRPADSLLPPGMPGFREPDAALLRGPALAAARTLVAGRHPTLTLAVRDRPDEVAAGSLIGRELARIGVRVVVHRVPDTFGAKADLLLTNWQADYPDPADFLNVLLDPRTVAAQGGSPRFAGAAWIRRLRRAEATNGPARPATYAALSVELARRAAPWAVIGVYQRPELLSSRLGCRVYQPAYGSLSPGQLCLRR